MSASALRDEVAVLPEGAREALRDAGVGDEVAEGRALHSDGGDRHAEVLVVLAAGRAAAPHDRVLPGLARVAAPGLRGGGGLRRRGAAEARACVAGPRKPRRACASESDTVLTLQRLQQTLFDAI